jgi:xylose dehydrogenase (NAD/NADP)
VTAATRAGSEPVRWGFLAAGWIAKRALAPAVHCASGAVLQAAAARDVTRASGLGPVGGVYGSYDELIADPDVDAVYISLSNEAHCAWTIAALEAGKHVLCEKPLAMNADEVRQMIAAAGAADRLLVEATWSRWHPRTQRAQALLATGTIGRVVEVEAAFAFDGVAEGNYRLEPERGGGALYDVGPYAVGAALWAVPGVDVEVLGVQRRDNERGADLVTRMSLRLGDARADVLCAIGEDAGEWVRIVGDRGSITLEGDAHSNWLAPSVLTLTGDEDMRLEFAPVDPYQVMVEQVSAAVRGDASAWVMPLEESLRVASTLDAIFAAQPHPS